MTTLHYDTIRYITIQESLANAKVSARQPLLLPKNVKQRKIPRTFELIAVQGHPRSSTLVPIESAYATSY